MECRECLNKDDVSDAKLSSHSCHSHYDLEKVIAALKQEIDGHLEMLVLCQTTLSRSLERMKKAELQTEALRKELAAMESAKAETAQQARAIQAELMQSHASVAKKLREALDLNKGWQSERDQLQGQIRELGAQVSARKMENSVLRDEMLPLLNGVKISLDGIHGKMDTLEAASVAGGQGRVHTKSKSADLRGTLKEVNNKNNK